MPESGYYRFIGKNGSLGYKRGEVYFLTLGHDMFPVRIIEARGIRTPNGSRCPYGSVESFEKNWLSCMASDVSETPDAS